MGTRVRRGSALRAALVVLLGLALTAPASLVASPATATDDTRLYLVTLDRPGLSAHRGSVPTGLRELHRVVQQDRVLSAVGAPAPDYRWTTALNGVAVRLTVSQAETLSDDPRVRLVEPNAVRRLSGRATAPGRAGSSLPSAGSGAGQVIGVVDTGLWRDSPLFAPVGRMGHRLPGFRGECAGGDGWSSADCDGKVVGARWFVSGFGPDRLRTGTPLSASDDNGHGTAVASIAAGDRGVSVTAPGQRRRPFGGAAPRARLAVYKACWAAPDPADDGCATADLVTAIDQATRDGVDVLSLAVAGPPRIDTVELALLGAAERDVVVVAAAGNDGARAYAAHPVPWVTSVGASVSDLRRGTVRAPDGSSWPGAMTARRGVGPTRVVLGREVAAAGSSVRDARICLPGSLDVARTEGRLVVCERGGSGRVEKSAAVRAADGVGMVLVNTEPGSVTADLHSLPTVHLTRDQGRSLVRRVVRHPDTRLALRPSGVSGASRPVAWSSPGDPAGGLVKPDLVAPGVGVLAATPPGPTAARWTLFSGTSAATAAVAGLAAGLRSRHDDWPAARIRSVLATTAAPLPGGVLHQGSGLVRAARSPGLVLDQPVEDYRTWLHDPGRRLNTTSLLVGGGSTSTRTVTNVTGRAGYWSSSASGFTGHQVSVTPAAVRLRPGEHAHFTVRVSEGSAAVDDGWVVWRGGDGTQVRLPLVVSR